MARTLPSALGTSSVTLRTGRAIQLRHVELDTATQVFYYGGFDVSDSLSPSQRLAFPGYDVEAYNYRLSAERLKKQGRESNHDTRGFWGVFTDGIAGDLDPKAPGSLLNRLFQLLFLAGTVATLYFIFSIIKTAKAK